MGLLTRLISRREAVPTTGSPENPNTPWDVVAGMVDAQSATPAGMNVTEQSALRTSVVYACTRVISETIAALPLCVYQRLRPQGKKAAESHPYHKLLHDQPNERMDSMVWREVLLTHVLLWGNGYCLIESSGGGRVTALWPLLPWNVRPELVGDSDRPGSQRLTYIVRTEAGDFRRYQPYEILHIRGLGLDGVQGLSVVGQARKAIGLAMATEEFGSRFFGNGARPGGFLQHPSALSDKAATRLRQNWEDRHGGPSNAHRVAVLEEGMTYNPAMIPPEDAQFLQSRQFSVVEIARYFRMPLHKVQDYTHATFSNVEQLGIEFVGDTIQPWCVRLEQALSRQVFGDMDRRYFAEVKLDALNRGDMATRYQAYATGRNGGWLSANDIRDAENLNPLDEDIGDQYLIPMNMVPAGAPPKPAAPSPPPDQPPPDQPPPDGKPDQPDPPPPPRSLGRRQDDDETHVEGALAARFRLRSGFSGIFEGAYRQILAKEQNDIIAAVKRIMGERELTTMLAYLDDYYSRHQGDIASTLAPTLSGYMNEVAAAAADEVAASAPTDLGAFISAYGDSAAARYAGASRAGLTKAISEAVQTMGDPLQATTDLFEQWRKTRPADAASDETVRSGDAAARVSYERSGVTKLKWHRSGGHACPHCAHLNGRVVEIDKHFVSAGEALQPDGADEPLRPSTNIGHPPAHRACVCVLLASHEEAS